MLRGDEVGALLAHHLLARGRTGTFATTIVSSTLLGTMARAAGQPYVETLTGFKWIGRVEGLAFGYEEALGYCCDPDHVKDKDGVSALLLLCELAAETKAAGRTLVDVLDDLAVAHGLHATDQLSVRVSELSQIADAMARLRASTPASLGGFAVVGVDDLALGSLETTGLPPTEGLRFRLAEGARVVVRPSGTEPKLKCYLEVVVPGGRRGGRRRVADLRGGPPGRHQARHRRRARALASAPDERHDQQPGAQHQRRDLRPRRRAAYVAGQRLGLVGVPADAVPLPGLRDQVAQPVLHVVRVVDVGRGALGLGRRTEGVLPCRPARRGPRSGAARGARMTLRSLRPTAGQTYFFSPTRTLSTWRTTSSSTAASGMWIVSSMFLRNSVSREADTRGRSSEAQTSTPPSSAPAATGGRDVVAGRPATGRRHPPPSPGRGPP